MKSITLAGFKIEKVIHQQNRRAGEANVANPYGTSGTDFYVRCIKSTTTDIKTDKDEFEHFVLTKAIEIIALRNEPTPYQFLFDGILAEISSAGFDLENFDEDIQHILKKKVGLIFKINTNGDNKVGNYWWFIKPENHIKYPDRRLSDRVEESIIALLRRKPIVSLGDVLGDIFQSYPNGLTPDVKSIDKILKKYATQSNGKWLYCGIKWEPEYTKHTEMLFYLSEIGHKMGYRVFVGKREQFEQYNNGKKLSEFADYQDLDFLPIEKDRINRIAMIDMLWLKGNEIKYVIEVENTTKFTSAIQRASNVGVDIPKLMVIPDDRKDELLRTNDPLFTCNFKSYNWKYIFYSDIENIKSSRKIDFALLETFTQEL